MCDIALCVCRGKVEVRLDCGVMLVDARYSNDSNGLTIRNITRADDGEYTCRAEVKSEGRYDEKRITVAVHSASLFLLLFIPTMHSLLPKHRNCSVLQGGGVT